MAADRERERGGDWLLSAYARHGSEMITILEPWGVPRYESPEIHRALGYKPMDSFGGGPEGGAWTENVHPDDVEKMSEAVKRSVSELGEQPPVEYRIRDSAGEWRWFESRGVNLTEDPEVAGIAVFTRDVTDRKRAELPSAEAISGERWLRTLTESVPAVIFAFDDDGVITFDAGGRLSGFMPGAGVGASVFELYGDRPRVLDKMRRALAGEEVTDPVELESASGEVFFDARCSPLRDGGGGVEGAVCVATDVTGRKRLEGELAHRATHDPLTGLPNRTLLMDRLGHVLERTGRDGRPLAVILLDLDGFKEVNDSSGHDAGDALLVAASRRLESLLRASDTACRLGGDEFAILLEDADAAGASGVAERIVRGFSTPFGLPAGLPEARVTVSVGVVSYPRPGTGERFPEEPEEPPEADPRARAKSLLREADRAMYEVKASGKAGYRLA